MRLAATQIVRIAVDSRESRAREQRGFARRLCSVSGRSGGCVSPRRRSFGSPSTNELETLHGGVKDPPTDCAGGAEETEKLNAILASLGVVTTFFCERQCAWTCCPCGVMLRGRENILRLHLETAHLCLVVILKKGFERTDLCIQLMCLLVRVLNCFFTRAWLVRFSGFIPEFSR